MLAEPNITNDGVLHQDVNEFSSGEKVIGVIIWILIEVFGNFMLFGIAHFDRFGGDPLKRRITDKVRHLTNCNSVYRFLNLLPLRLAIFLLKLRIDFTKHFCCVHNTLVYAVSRIFWSLIEHGGNNVKSIIFDFTSTYSD